MGEKQKGVKMLQVCKNTIMNEYRNKMKYNVIKLLVSASLQFRNRPKLVKPAAINRNRWTFEVNRNCNQSWTWSGPSMDWVGLGRVGLGHKILCLRWIGLVRVLRQKYLINIQLTRKKPIIRRL